MSYYKQFKHKTKYNNESVGQSNVGQTVKTSIRIDRDNYENIQRKVNEINSLDENMQTDFSKTLNNILSDYFLDEKIERQKFELEGIE